MLFHISIIRLLPYLGTNFSTALSKILHPIDYTIFPFFIVYKSLTNENTIMPNLENMRSILRLIVKFFPILSYGTREVRLRVIMKEEVFVFIEFFIVFRNFSNVEARETFTRNSSDNCFKSIIV